MTTLLKLSHSSILKKHFWKEFVTCRNISTSKKNTTTKSECPSPEPKPPEPKTPEPQIKCGEIKCDETVTNWVSYGFNYEDEKEDRDTHNASFFFSVTLCLVFGSFAWAYAPDVHMRDWAQREAFLVLRQREKFGEPLISPHFIAPELIKLPDEDDLCEVPVII